MVCSFLFTVAIATAFGSLISVFCASLNHSANNSIGFSNSKSNYLVQMSFFIHNFNKINYIIYLMSFNTFGKLFRFTTWGESHGPAIGCVVDGCPPNISINEADIQRDLNKRKPGQSKFTTQRKEDDKVNILSGIFEGKTTGTIYNYL